jgi:hypothetical protein
MRRRWTSAGWIVFWTTAAAAISAAGLGAGCGRSIGFEIPGQSNGEPVGASGGSAGSNIGSGGRSGTAGISNSAGINGTNGSNGTGGSNAGTAGLSSGSGTGSPGTGTSAGSITATGTSTGGSSTGTCIAGPTAELGSCNSDADCSCPLHCIAATGGSVCERACQTTGDCPNLETLCMMGNCAPNFCGAHGVGPTNGELDGTCDAVGTNDGSCIPLMLNGTNVGLCSQAGTAPTTCNPLATRSDLGQACVAGDVCLLLAGQANCFTMCDHDARAPCGSGMDCIVPLSTNPRLGICEPSSAATGGSSTGATGGATGGTGGTTGGCSPFAPLEEFATCTTTADCGCPLVCNDDPLQAQTGSVCEYPCPTTGCPNPLTICGDGGICVTDGCGSGTGNGTFNSTCTVDAGTDGTCLPELLGDTSVGYCFLAGTASFDAGGCSLIATSGEPTELCPAGALCFGVGDKGTCSDLCDPNAQGGCPGGSFCADIVDEPDLGICIEGF